jgi:diguanylate cyclase (GGDEF)-like protein
VLIHKTAASTDPLTGLFNRRGFMEAAQHLIETQRRKGQPVTVLMFDLDHFKSINDRFGHDVGDDALRVFGATIAESMRTNDVVGRLGGEEFAAILPGNLVTSVPVAERVRLAFEAAGVTIAGHTMDATVSIGAAGASASACEISSLLARADRALYRAKSAGRNRVSTEHTGAVEDLILAATAPPPLAPGDATAREDAREQALPVPS